MLPIVIALVGLVALGTIQVRNALIEADDADRAQVLATLAGSTSSLVQELQREANETLAYVQRSGASLAAGGVGKPLLDSQKARTDQTLEKFMTAGESAENAAPDLRGAVTSARSSLLQLETARTEAIAADLNSRTSGLNEYNKIAVQILLVADKLPDQIANPKLAAQARATAAIATAKQFTAHELILVRDILAEGKYNPTKLAEVADVVGQTTERIGEFYRYADPGIRFNYDQIAQTIDFDNVTKYRMTVLKGIDSSEVAWKEIAPEAWTVAMSNTLLRLYYVELDVTTWMETSASELTISAQQRALATGSIALGVTTVTLTIAILFAVRTSRRLRVLRRNALTVADESLPGAVADVAAAGNSDEVGRRLRLAMESAPMSRANRNDDEIGQVAVAFDAVHEQALRLAADQSLLRLDVEALFIALARRGQSLVQRQLRLLDEFEEAETDPDVLARLFALDHLAARMRRNEENLLVLAGGDPGRRYTTPEPVASVVRAAAGEIEDYTRVEIDGAGDVPITAHSVGDLVHLLAELLENAAVFSPPTSQVRVTVRRSVNDLAISIADEGIGMPPEQLEAANERLREPSALTSATAGTMGLLVVARLAARRDIEVQLHSTAGKGTLAMVRVPDAMIATDRSVDTFDDRPPLGAGLGRDPLPPRASRPMPIAGRPPAAVVDNGQRPRAIAAAPEPRPVVIPERRPTPVTDQRVPRPRGADERPPTQNVGANGALGTDIVPTGWFRPTTGSGDTPALPPGSLEWRSGPSDTAYAQVQRVLAEPAAEAAPATTGGLPQRRPGARLLPGSIDDSLPANGRGRKVPTAAEITGSIDPDEIRARLSGLASGTAAGREDEPVSGRVPSSSTMQLRSNNPQSHSRRTDQR
ncbi:nitrate- and nitrite sensing domain-containing protein [Phytomonospora sp. NPDC050363]|uniref:nitrate- and nitrite sensing domain-containing protein n=1 Tax=Phytomonospora sp. NPDC050363 TaxID=3155642 RepID=UPI0033C2A4A8